MEKSMEHEMETGVNITGRACETPGDFASFRGSLWLLANLARRIRYRDVATY